MLTDQLDAAYFALDACRRRVPALRGVLRVGTPERAALDEALAAIERLEQALRSRPPGGA